MTNKKVNAELSELNKKINEQLPNLITQIKEGKEEAKEKFAVLLLPYIKKMITRYKKTIDDEIESLAGFVITKLIDKIDMIDLSKPVLSFITRVAINQAIDQHRKFKHNKSNNTVEYLPFGEYDQCQVLSGVSTEHTSQLQSALEEYLPRYDADLLTMYYLENVPLSEIAGILGQSEEDIEEAIEHAKQNLVRAVK